MTRQTLQIEQVGTMREFLAFVPLPSESRLFSAPLCLCGEAADFSHVRSSRELAAGEQPSKRAMLQRINRIHLRTSFCPSPSLAFSSHPQEASELRKQTQGANTLFMKEMPGNAAGRTHWAYPSLRQ
jgi:hypothetical protein